MTTVTQIAEAQSRKLKKNEAKKWSLRERESAIGVAKNSAEGETRTTKYEKRSASESEKVR